VIIAKNGVLTVIDVLGTTNLYKVIDEAFEPAEFTVKITNENKGEVVKLVEVNFLTVKVTDKTTGKFDKALVNRIGIKDTPDKLVLKDEIKGIFVSENRIAVDKLLTVQIVYNQLLKEQQVSSANSANEVVFEVLNTTAKRDILSWVAMSYPSTSVIVDRRVEKIKSVLLNGIEIPVDATTNLGNGTVLCDGTLTLDPAFVNAPVIKVANFEKIESVIVMATSDLITSKADIVKTKSILTFNKAFTQEELKNLITTRGDVSVFRMIQRKSDLMKENFYCLLFAPEQLKVFKTLFNV
jgi:hypothetical protein